MAVESEPYTDAKGEFRWRLVASSGQTIATGGEGYQSEASGNAAIESFRKNEPEAAIQET